MPGNRAVDQLSISWRQISTHLTAKKGCDRNMMQSRLSSIIAVASLQWHERYLVNRGSTCVRIGSRANQSVFVVIVS